ncbi:MAG: 50S ribosomal protein L9 [Planctomycetota bacterium]|nr:50S ribosomal protein L9 [Planctomycetota bacterium]
MPKSQKLLLTENVEHLGIVGDVVNVRNGYARNFLMPRNLATAPSEAKIKELAAKREDAQRQLAIQRKEREELSARLKGVELTLTRSCNDQGILYASITQQDIAAALVEKGHAVKPRDIRIAQTMKRIDTYDVHVKLDSDLDSVIKVWVVADRKLDLDRAGEPAAPAEAAQPGDAAGDAGTTTTEAKPEGQRSDKPRKGKGDEGEKPAKKDDKPDADASQAKPEKKAEKKSEKKPKAEKGDDKSGGDAPKSVWSAKPQTNPFEDMKLGRSGGRKK